ncbi:MAG: HAD family hydrolase [Ruminococcaceae bacterium]|nr:HAD family hydrolase [Oscillospiraceae bacterium]
MIQLKYYKRAKMMKIYSLLNPEKEYLKGKKAFIFDMDGTLIDSMRYWRLTAGDDMSKYPTHIDYMFEKYNAVIEPKSNALKLLGVLHENGVPVAIASDTPRQLAEGFFKRFDFDSVIDCYVGSDDVGTYKHLSSEIFLLAAKKLGVSPEECVVFEDNLTSVYSAVNAGMAVVGIFDGENAINEEKIRKVCVDYIYDLGEMLK